MVSAPDEAHPEVFKPAVVDYASNVCHVGVDRLLFGIAYSRKYLVSALTVAAGYGLASGVGLSEALERSV